MLPKGTDLLSFILFVQLNTNENEIWLVTEVTPEYWESNNLSKIILWNIFALSANRINLIARLQIDENQIHQHASQ